ncbi:D-isomer specific 2-hydroxyacid dehydrogenase NAD-binding protein [Xylanimonas cellulosilytica DSM 15894]|uniref:D-3-phosphoglycerate dehydrogenase n=1 Tax=Xylanimonas cellulosilytica (strain DSM 15894 / JCM 12276 / CECT 5975 / KCTC 9989 / LMG 20990 / NBRC 107835 / XIL07) TaxID=446471 RepID=D1C0A3_XYLCX|nr:phosphoglycerate dehydrogenase [Xylanimonas cellulosilytica]ACZ30292.1 D-isomer specific 2-hydroxyacid dehydrogenase NAD-binding protein [Xylanimonas cellulosilytica DSM 15894]
MLRVLLLENVHPVATEILRTAGFDVEVRSGALDEAELIEALEGVHVLGIRSKTNVTRKVIEASPGLQAIGTFSIGTNQIDLAAAAAHGVAVFNAPYSNTRSVVELALAEIISLTRRLPVRDKALHDGVWDKTADGAHEVRGRTLGIIGYGNIGSQLSVLAENLGMRVVFYDVQERLSLGNAYRAKSLDELLELSDAVTIHVDGRPGNAGFFGADLFERMKPGAIFLNLSRGFVVDVEALRAGIESGHLAGAAVDVFPAEPKKRGEHFESPLRGLPNVILTPHVGGSTEEAQEAIGEFVAGKVRDYINTGSTMLSVNLPNLQLPPTGVGRIMVLHRNVPGVLAAINQVFAEHGANIEGQMLATRGEIGYVVTDISDVTQRGSSARLMEMPTTVRLRIRDAFDRPEFPPGPAAGA